jgi:hypothetical protein
MNHKIEEKMNSPEEVNERRALSNTFVLSAGKNDSDIPTKAWAMTDPEHRRTPAPPVVSLMNPVELLTAAQDILFEVMPPNDVLSATRRGKGNHQLTIEMLPGAITYERHLLIKKGLREKPALKGIYLDRALTGNQQALRSARYPTFSKLKGLVGGDGDAPSLVFWQNADIRVVYKGIYQVFEGPWVNEHGVESPTHPKVLWRY